MNGTGADDGLAVFLGVRPRLFAIACRMLGSVPAAEDIVQDVWIRWHRTDRSLVRSPPAFLIAATTRLAINVIHSARARKETDIGAWLPEPVDTAADPGMGAELDEALNLAVRLLLQTLLPTERAAYVLREAFDYSYREIADILRIEVPNARQLVTRAREHVLRRRRTPVSPARERRLLHTFVAAAKTGDLASIENLFVSDAVSARVRHNASSCPVNGL